MFDPQAVRQWLDLIHGHTLGLTHICSTGDWAGRVFTDPEAATRYVTYLDSEAREGIYARVTTLRAALPPGRRGGAADTMALPALWADIDIAGPGHEHTPCAQPGCTPTHPCPAHAATWPRGGERILPLPPDEHTARAIITATGLPGPTVWVHSGGGLYPLWMLDTPHTMGDEQDQAAIKTLAADWQKVITAAAARDGWAYGSGVGDLARVLRIPGTINRKAGLTRACRMLDEVAGPRHTLTELVDALSAALATLAPPPTPTPAPITISAPTAERIRSDGDPGVDYNQRADWADILTPHGWREHYRDEKITYWTRPGKDSGTSATTNANGTDRLHVHTTNGHPFVAGESYHKFAAHTLLNHGGDFTAATRALAQAGYGTPVDHAAEQRELIAAICGPDHAAVATNEAASTGTSTASVDVTNSAEAAAWLRANIGAGHLAGLFERSGRITFIAVEGQHGYIPPRRKTDHDGPAQVRTITAANLAAYIDARLNCYRLVKAADGGWERKPAHFPAMAANRVVDLPDTTLRPALRRLAAVTHTPTVKADGSILDTPGYDVASGLYYLPDPDLVIAPIPSQPTAGQVRDALGLLDEMTAGFPWATEHDQANYYGYLITPLIRGLAPPPYKMMIFDAPQQGTGKTLLAELGRILHGAVFRGGVAHADNDEMRKMITTVLVRTTAPIVILDNLSGTLESPVLAALLTSVAYNDRALGANEDLTATNDRLWAGTANHLTTGPDMVRRNLWVNIDAATPRPQERHFAIANLPAWVRERRGQLLAALLTLIRSWVVAGRPTPAQRSSDGFGRWINTVEGILTHAGMPGQFAHPGTDRQPVSDDDTEWGEFLAAIHAVFAEDTWTARELLDRVNTGGIITPTTPMISLTSMPSALAEKIAKSALGPAGAAKTLGRWLANRDGRYVGDMCVRSRGQNRENVKMWRIERLSTESPAGYAGFARSLSLDTEATSAMINYGDHGGVGSDLGPANPANPANPARLVDAADAQDQSCIICRQPLGLVRGPKWRALSMHPRCLPEDTG